jgi:hypothetical protein
MSKFDDYKALGWVDDDPNDPARALITFTCSIPKAGIEAGMVELYATKKVKWTPEIQVVVTAGDGNQTIETQANPDDLFEACRKYWAKNLLEDTLEAYRELKQAELDAELEATKAVLI